VQDYEAEKKKGELERAKEEARLNGDYELTFGTPQGQRVLLDLLKQCGIGRNPFDRDQAIASFRAGRLDIGLYIQARLGLEDLRGKQRLTRMAIAHRKPEEEEQES